MRKFIKLLWNCLAVLVIALWGTLVSVVFVLLLPAVMLSIIAIGELWALNTLFPSLQIPYRWETVLAAIWILAPMCYVKLGKSESKIKT